MKEAIFEVAIKTILLEAESIKNLETSINEDFLQAVYAIHKIKGRVVVTGIGKSAIVGQKIVSTLNSTGTPSLFMHAADAIHGDLGMIKPSDIVIIISKSGESPEIKVLVPIIKNFGNIIIAITGNLSGYLAQNSTFILNTTVNQEACPNNLAPTTSTTAQMVMGDALAVALMELNGFKEHDFARFHPGGNLGKRLFLKVEDLYNPSLAPKVNENASIKEIIIEITSKMLGATAVLNNDKEVVGIITDGDLRRMLEKNENIYALKANDIYSNHPKTIDVSVLAIDALNEMRKFNISQLIVCSDNKYAGMLHIHQLINEGII